MGFGFKKEKEGDLAAKKSSLFSRSKSSKAESPAPVAANPYAVPPPSGDPYASGSGNPYANQGGMKSDPYAPKGHASSHQPPTASFGNLQLDHNAPGPGARRSPSPLPNRNEKSPVPHGGYDIGSGRERFQHQGGNGPSAGYGNDAYGGGPSRAGGYGGLGRQQSQETMNTGTGRDVLFGEAPRRAAEQQSTAPPGYEADQTYSNTGGFDSSEIPGGYGPSNALSAEDEENQELENIKQEISDIKNDDISRLRNASRIARQAQETGRSTMENLYIQRQHLYNAEGNLDEATVQSTTAEGKIQELRVSNRGMFVPNMHRGSKAKRDEASANLALERRKHERGVEEERRAHEYKANERTRRHQRDLNGNPAPVAKSERDYNQRNKFMFEEDEEEDKQEDQISELLPEIHEGARYLNGLAKGLGEELDSQNAQIDRINAKTESLDDEVARHGAKLKRFDK